MEFQIDVPNISNERAGNTGTPGVWHFDSGLPGPSVLVTALIHGNELCGAWALKELLAHGFRPKNGKLTLMFCNLAAFDTFDMANHDASRFVDIDLNRVWTEERLARQDLVECRRAAELRQWVDQADYLLDLHSMHEPSPPLLVAGVLKRNVEFGRQMSVTKHIIIDPGHRDGVRMRDFGPFGEEHGKAIAVLVECGFHGDPSSIKVARQSVGQFLLLTGVAGLDDLPEPWPELLDDLPESQVALRVTQPVVASGMDVRFTEPWQGMECIEKAGTVIGYDGQTPIETPYDNCTLIMPSLRQLIPGVTVVRLACTEH